MLAYCAGDISHSLPVVQLLENCYDDVQLHHGTCHAYFRDVFWGQKSWTVRKRAEDLFVCVCLLAGSVSVNICLRGANKWTYWLIDWMMCYWSTDLHSMSTVPVLFCGRERQVLTVPRTEALQQTLHSNNHMHGPNNVSLLSPELTTEWLTYTV